MNRAAESPREAVAAIAARLRSAGHVAYLAGGCVRDRLFGLDPDEFDLATDARPDEIQRLFPGSRGVGESFGVVLVRRGDHVFDVATFRTEGAYEDGRRPSSVSFSDAEHDAKRRDFTINGLFEDPETGEQIDINTSNRALRGAYLALEDRRKKAIEQEFRKLGIDMIPLRTNEDYLHVLRAFFDRREPRLVEEHRHELGVAPQLRQHALDRHGLAEPRETLGDALEHLGLAAGGQPFEDSVPLVGHAQ